MLAALNLVADSLAVAAADGNSGQSAEPFIE
jgi:hypothetical protein